MISAASATVNWSASHWSRDPGIMGWAMATGLGRCFEAPSTRVECVVLKV